MDEQLGSGAPGNERPADDSLDAQVDESGGQLPAKGARHLEARTRALGAALEEEASRAIASKVPKHRADPSPKDETQLMPVDVAQLLAEEARRIAGDMATPPSDETQLMDAGELADAGEAAGASIEADAGAEAEAGTEAGAGQGADPADPEADAADAAEPAAPPVASDATVPGVIPVDETVLRPAAQEDPNRYLRRTRDYDHDAQSVNTVSNAGRFGTIREERSSRDTRRDPYARSARKGAELGEGNSRSKLRPLLALLLVALVVAGGGAVLTYGMELWGGKSVPYVVTDSQANAERSLADKGFRAMVVAEPADDAIGKVLSQDPVAGTRAPEGSSVTIRVATNRTIPEVVGLSEEEARRLLEQAGADLVEAKAEESGEAEGTVIAVSPEAGKPFVSRSTVTLTVAAPFRVPDVVGKKESDAVDALKKAGLEAKVSYVNSDETVRTVVETSPAAGEVIAEGGVVKVKVSSPYPSDPKHLAEFFRHSSQDIDSYLQKNDYAFDKGFIDSYGNALQYYTSGDNGSMTFSSQPYLRSLALPKEGPDNVMAAGTPFAGVRFDLPARMLPGSYDRSAIDALASECGLTGIADICTNQSMGTPAGAKKIDATFTCANGKMDDLAWTILVVGNSKGMRAVVTCAKDSVYKASDLLPFGGSLCQYVAYQEVYLSSEYQVKEEKKDEKKDGEAGDTSDKGKDDESDKDGTSSSSDVSDGEKKEEGNDDQAVEQH